MPSPRLAVFAPSPVFTVTVEQLATGTPEIHFHAGGQGFWVARMAARLGASVVLCAPIGGESGRVLQALLDEDGIELRSLPCQGANGVYVHDRRSGERVEVAAVESPPLTRHEEDELFGVALTAGIECGVMMLTGSQPRRPRAGGRLPQAGVGPAWQRLPRLGGPHGLRPRRGACRRLGRAQDERRGAHAAVRARRLAGGRGPSPRGRKARGGRRRQRADHACRAGRSRARGRRAAQARGAAVRGARPARDGRLDVRGPRRRPCARDGLRGGAAARRRRRCAQRHPPRPRQRQPLRRGTVVGAVKVQPA